MNSPEFETYLDSCVREYTVIIVATSLTTGGSTNNTASQRTRSAPLAPEGTETRSTLHEARNPPTSGGLNSVRCQISG